MPPALNSKKIVTYKTSCLGFRGGGGGGVALSAFSDILVPDDKTCKV